MPSCVGVPAVARVSTCTGEPCGDAPLLQTQREGEELRVTGLAGGVHAAPLQLGKESVKSSLWDQKSCQEDGISVSMVAPVSELADFSGEDLLML